MAGQAVLVVSFGTSHLDTLEKTIQPIEWDIAGRMTGRVQRRAFTSGMILRKLERRDGLHIDDVPQALSRLAAEGFDDVVLQPTHIMNGDEYDKLAAQTEPFREKFVRLAVGRPLLTTVQDYKVTAQALLQVLPTREKDTALVFMGHGTEHFANSAYCQLEYVFHDLGRTDILVGTVAGPPVQPLRVFPVPSPGGPHGASPHGGLPVRQSDALAPDGRGHMARPRRPSPKQWMPPRALSHLYV